jgi:hypothetical protein
MVIHQLPSSVVFRLLLYDDLVRILSALLTAACAASLAWLNLSARVAAAPQAGAPATVFIDVSAADENGRPLTTLRKEDLRVAIDGEPRSVVSLRYVFRGPGSQTAAALADPSRQSPAAAERSRMVLLAVDETSFAPGDEKPVVDAVARVLDVLGTADQAAVVSLPIQPRQVALSAEPASRRAGLRRVAGRKMTTAPQKAILDASESGSGGARGEDALRSTGGDPDETAGTGEADRLVPIGDRDVEVPPSRADVVPLLGGLRRLPGVKSLIVFRQAGGADDPQAGAAGPDREREAIARVVLPAAAARTTIHVVSVGSAPRNSSAADDELRAIVTASGGTVTAAKNAGDAKAFDELRAALGGAYLVEVEGRAGDGGDRPHAVEVQSARSRTTVRAPRFWLPRGDPVPPIVVTTPPAAPAAAPAPAAAAPAAPAPALARRPKPLDAETAVLVARMTEYLDGYVRDFVNVVAEEDYSQRMIRGAGSGPMVRRLRSDVLLVRTANEIGWIQYRDVFEVDGKPVRDREARVQKLFLENPSNARRLAEEISSESARYNIGEIRRTINTPTLALVLLGPTFIRTLSFHRSGEDTVNGVRAVRLAYEELGRPTLVQAFELRVDAPAVGALWIDPSNGRILKTEISVDNGFSQGSATVIYRPASDTGLWVPAQMDENYRRAGEEIEGRAIYKNFRSFNVTTDTQIKK